MPAYWRCLHFLGSHSSYLTLPHFNSAQITANISHPLFICFQKRQQEAGIPALHSSPTSAAALSGLAANESQRETGLNREEEGGYSEKLLDSCGRIQVERKPEKEAKQKQGTDLNSPQSKGPYIYRTLYNLLGAFLYLLHLIFRKTL